jgi:hypothetical protein
MRNGFYVEVLIDVILLPVVSSLVHAKTDRNSSQETAFTDPAGSVDQAHQTGQTGR